MSPTLNHCPFLIIFSLDFKTARTSYDCQDVTCPFVKKGLIMEQTWTHGDTPKFVLESVEYTAVRLQGSI